MIAGGDLSIGQRLAIGFGVLLLLFAAMFGLFYNWHTDSARAQAEYAERIAPVREHISALERATFRVAISVRSLLIDPTADRIATFSDAIAGARAAVDGLGAASEGDDATLYRQITAIAHGYLAAAERLAQRRELGPVDSPEEATLNSQRLALLGYTSQLGELQDQRAHAALDRITTLRERVSQGLTTALIATLLLLAALAWLTARSVSRPASALADTALAMQRGDWRPALKLAAANGRAARDELHRLGAALGAAAVALEAREERLKADGRVSKRVASTLDASELAASVLQQVIAHSGAEVGVVYRVHDGGADLTPIATHALAMKLPPVRHGEGAPGAAAAQKSTIVVRDIPADSGFRIKLGYDEAPPRTLVAAPLLFGDLLHGVLVVASLREFSADALAFIDASAAQLGLGLQNAAAYERVQTLLAQVRASNEQVQAQNEELQAQSQQLQVQHEEIQAQNEELAQQGAELRRHATELAEADERKNRFLGVLAHELRNPMAPITNSLFILRNSPPGSEGALRAQTIIERQATHLVRLIDDLLDVTRITEGKIRIERAPLDLVDMTRACIDDLTAAFEQAGVVLDLALPAAPVGVHGDRTRLCQALGNLLNNSLKFTPRGGRVTVSIETTGESAVLRVRDDGVGMEADLLPRLFQPFSQGAASLARTQGGLGLGLALVKMLVNLHEGSVHAFSAGPNLGSEFTIRLPLAGAQHTHEAPATHTPMTAEDRKGVRILLIEDNRDAASTLLEALQLEGYQVALAHSGADGVALAREFRPQVVLCDIGLPGQDGYDTARALRAEPCMQSALLIALTGYASAPDRESARAAGFDLHLAKPLSIASLPAIIAQSSRRSATPSS